MNATSFGVRCRQIRKRKQLSQRDVGFRGGMDPSAVNRIELDQREPQLKSLLALAKGLDIIITIRPEGLFVDDPEEE